MSTYTRRVSTPGSPDLSGEILDGRYELLEHLADGGMASVYRALDMRLDREVALKILRPHLVHDEEFVRRFEREARASARLSHPNIVGVLDQGEDAGRMFITMEYVPGRTLRDVLDEEGSLTARAALDILDPVLDALGHAHRSGLIHRDVKPENVLLREDGVVKVADFGLVRAVSSQTVTSSSSVLLGTVAYVSPEQVGRGIADARSDVYAAGLILFEMLTGTKAYSGDVPVNVAFMHVHEDVPKVSSRAAGTPKALDHAVSTASARDPDARPVDAAAFRALLGSVRSKLSPAQLDRRLGVQHPGSSGSGTTVALPVGSDTPDRSATTAQILTGPSSTARSDGGHGGDGRGGASSGALAPRASDAPRRRRRWPWVLVVLSALLLGLTVWTFTQGPLTPTPVPVVANKTVAEAHAALDKVGLAHKDRQAFSEDVAAGVVISSEPGAGTTIWKSASVDLIVSKGPERYGVPTLEGVEITQALEALKNARLSSGTQSQQFSETVPEGTVISSDPAAGSPLPPGGAVNLVVSKGRQPIDLADWAGKPYEQAEAKLTADGLKATVSGRENSDTVAKGSIIAQTPQTGPLFKGDTVQFVVSEGPVLVAVPDVFGKQAQDAEAALKAAGFNVKVEKLLGGVFGTVREQDPAAGTKVPKGSTITIRVV